MTWLSYSDDEVRRFHPVFESSAKEALASLKLDGKYRWDHHVRDAASALIPDFVLVERASNRWQVAVELKRRPESLYSERNQVQAKGYADSSALRFRTLWPRYFALSNLEDTLLFAANLSPAVRDCRVDGPQLAVGQLGALTQAEFEAGLTQRISELVDFVLRERDPSPDVSWVRVALAFGAIAEGLVGHGRFARPQSDGWPVVERAFGRSRASEAAYSLALRCLLPDVLRGMLERAGHPNSGRLRPVPTNRAAIPTQLPRVWDRLRELDFSQAFDASTAPGAGELAAVRDLLSAYFEQITEPPTNVYRMARERSDAYEIFPVLVEAARHDADADASGKVPTDPELAALLAELVIQDRPGTVLDPGAGEGALLVSAYHCLAGLGLQPSEALALLRGIESDSLHARIAATRLALQEPASVNRNFAVSITHGDMFADPARFNVDYVVMNPPFRRYEHQGENSALPQEVREHYRASIEALTGREAACASGQQNLYSYYVEWVLNAVPAGTRFGIILDNKWYHNKYAAPLRSILLRLADVEAIVEYPYGGLFNGVIIATSILVGTRRDNAGAGYTRFVRSTTDLRQADPKEVSTAVFRGGPLPTGWTMRAVPQRSLKPEIGWKSNFDPGLAQDFTATLPALRSLFRRSRRGSLAKEEGGMSSLAFPFSRSSYGYVRAASAQATRRYQNERVRALSVAENAYLSSLAADIPMAFRGFAIENPDVVHHYELTESDVGTQATIEPPSLRGEPVFNSQRRTAWTAEHALAVDELMADPHVARFVTEFRRLTGLSPAMLSEEDLWVGLREPAAGELVVPRKLRGGHKIFVNPFPRYRGDRQIRLSSNFISFAEPICVDEGSGVDRMTAVKTIAAFLMSSYGQLQLEMLGANREGLLAVEDHHLAQVRVLDPRSVSRSVREEVIVAAGSLPFPVSNGILSISQVERNQLDVAIARGLAEVAPGFDTERSLGEVHHMLDEYILAREP